MEKQIELRKQEKEASYEMFQAGNSIGFIRWSKNHFHSLNLYLEMQLTSYDKGISRDLFALLQQERKETFQIMCDSTEKNLIDFIETAGFACKRKCYECEVCQEDLKVELASEISLVLVKYPENEYLEVSKILYQQYDEKHAAVNPVTVSFEEFLEILPQEVYVELQKEKIINFAFVEENEIAYVGSVNQETYHDFIVKVVELLFGEYETICFECDDIDWEAMQLRELFLIEDDNSYNTYIKERTEE